MVSIPARTHLANRVRASPLYGSRVLGWKKWKRLHFLTRSRRRWLLIWGCLGLLETVVVAGLLWAGYFPEPVPGFPGWAGEAAWTVLRPFHLYNILLDFVLGFLFAAIGETTIGVAFAALVWWIFSLFSEPSDTPRTIAPAQRYAIALLASACILGIANRIYALRPPTCFDCFAPHGFPFTYFHEGGFAGGEGFVWSGVAGDTLLIFAVGVIVGWIWNRTSHSHSLKAANS